MWFCRQTHTRLVHLQGLKKNNNLPALRCNAASGWEVWRWLSCVGSLVWWEEQAGWNYKGGVGTQPAGAKEGERILLVKEETESESSLGWMWKKPDRRSDVLTNSASSLVQSQNFMLGGKKHSEWKHESDRWAVTLEMLKWTPNKSPTCHHSAVCFHHSCCSLWVISQMPRECRVQSKARSVLLDQRLQECTIRWNFHCKFVLFGTHFFPFSL